MYFFFVISKLDVKMENGDRKLFTMDSFPVYLSCMYDPPFFSSFLFNRTYNAGNALVEK